MSETTDTTRLRMPEGPKYPEKNHGHKLKSKSGTIKILPKAREYYNIYENEKTNLQN